MDEIEKRRIEHLLKVTEHDDQLGVVPNDDTENSQMLEKHVQNTDTEQPCQAVQALLETFLTIPILNILFMNLMIVYHYP